MNFVEMIQTLESYGLLDVLLPFLLVFTISFAVLQKSNILGDNKRPFNKIVAFVMAMAVVIPHVLMGTASKTDAILTNGMIDVVEVMNNSLPNVSLIMVACMMALLLIGVFGKDVNIGETDLISVVVIFSIIAVAVIFANSAGWIGTPPSWLGWLFDEETTSLIIIILVFGLIIWFITREERPEDKRKPLKDFFQGIYGKGK
ncbi:hypothetical protein JXB41_04155 [Candidatus Woesearchaeota archaeon]|nr:hypothetical protein [Candidatus Woesearchaeota archaeon]